mmetsp:Transcript_21739/g.45889  ORF Transcript_21739/g.45889 Transcript_21739/m.45889 type:complete len:109 (+) Transcript_21739:281-607(+)
MVPTPDERSRDVGSSSSTTKPPRWKGYLFLGIGLLFLLHPVVSFATFSWSSLLPGCVDDNPPRNDGNGNSLLGYWNEVRPFLRVATLLPATLVVCICHWVSFRIYLRR